MREFTVRKYLINLQDDEGNERTKKTSKLTFQEAARVAYIERAQNNFKFIIKSIVEID
jgi:hypothetical protein